MAHRNFGLRDSAHRFWSEPSDPRGEERWAFTVIGVAVLAILFLAVLVA